MVFTNTVGVAFTAALLSASDAGVTVVFPEDGATNTLAWTQLTSASQEAVCEAARFSPVPPSVASAYQFARKELVRVAALERQNRLDAVEAARRRQAIANLFQMRCREQGVTEVRSHFLLARLDSISN